MNYSADGKICFISPIVLPILWFLGSPCKKGEDIPFLGIARPQPHIHVSVSDLYSPRIGLHISSSRVGRPIVGIYKSLTDAWMWKLGLRPRYSFFGNICFEISVFCLCSALYKFFIFLIKYNGYMRGFVNNSHICRGSSASLQDSEKGWNWKRDPGSPLQKL